MANDCGITHRLLLNQQTMFRLAALQGWSHKAIHLSTGMSLSAIGEYARGEAAMSGPAILKLATVKDFPSELMSLLFDGTNRHVSDDVENEEILDELACEASAFTHDYVEAKRDGNITPIERSKLHSRRTRMAAIAGSAA